MPDTSTATLLAEAFTWYSTGLRDLVQELLDDAGLDTTVDTADDLCGDLWLHAAELTAVRTLSFTEILDLLDRNADLLVGRLQHRPQLILAGRLDTAADAVDVAELAAAATDHGPLPRPRSRWALTYMSALHTAA
ncbi:MULTISPECIES: hypothetical protein [Streptomycetaceae]|uniref:hypothetical protein n=1 Tax=Streptomycetaceae TaxID=2062 RepID=UPI00093BAC2E|nr:hypothetical protein [Streptomyces sp. CB02056]OKH97533.1 hypothetical protein AMK13_38125 [Streptomyces sp. CB02056]